jgi:hypothetical protein
MFGHLRRTSLGFSLLLLPSLSHAAWTLRGECRGSSACGPLSASDTLGTFDTQSECEAAKAGAQCVILACSSDCAPCTVTSSNFFCVESAAGGGAKKNTIVLPGADFLPGGSLLSQSQFEEIAGGLHGLGDISLMASGYGDAFFNPHYTDSFQNWLLDLDSRLAAQWQSAFRNGAGDRPSLFSDGTEPGTTRGFENAYADAAMESNFFYELQTRQTAVPGETGATYMTLDEIQRQKLKDQGSSPVIDGFPLAYPKEPDITPPDNFRELVRDQLQEQGQGAASWIADRIGIGEAYSRVEEAGGLYAGYVQGLYQSFEKAAKCGVAGDIQCYNEAYREMVGQSETFNAQVQNLTINRFNEALGSAFGGLVELAAPVVESARDMARDVQKRLGSEEPASWNDVADAVRDTALNDLQNRLQDYGAEVAQGAASEMFQETRFPAAKEGTGP